jgi:hypothetical protein
MLLPRELEQAVRRRQAGNAGTDDDHAHPIRLR